MKSLRVLGLAVAVLASLPAAAAVPIRTEPVQFQAGHSSALLKGEIQGEAIVDYTLQARADRTMVVRLKSRKPDLYFNVLAPGQDTAIHIGSTSGNEFAGRLPATGTYTVRVYLMRSAARRNERADYTLEIAIDAGAKPAAAASAPATRHAAPAKWDASGEVRCSTGTDALDRRCGFRVVRDLPRKSAQVWIAAGDGAGATPRYLRFEGQAFATDDGATLTSRRQGDNWLVGVDGRHFYLIPDALLFGG